MRTRIQHRAHRRNPEAGFTLVEMVVAMGIAAVAFSALAGLLLSSLKAVAVQKARTQGNEVATQGIEDLQRLNYNALGLCNPPSAPIPAGLADTVILPNCAGPPPKFEPCGGTPAAGAVPDEEYVCTRVNIAFEVRRFVAYGDIAHTEKRLAVFVKWRDNVGVHEVSQQSSLRIPSRTAVIGLAPPTIDLAGTNVAPPNISLNPDGTNNTNINLMANTTGLVATDSVLVGFSSLVDDGTGTLQPVARTVALTSGNGTNWSGNIASGSTTFGNPATSGSQFFTFTAIRKVDGKVNSLVYPSANPPAAPAAPLQIGTAGPATVSVSSVPTKVDIDASGALVSPPGAGYDPFAVAVATSNVSSQDTMILVFGTQTGAVSIALSPDPFNGGLGPCIVGMCNTIWRGSINQGAGYPLLPGNQYLYFIAIQGNGPDPVDVGSTAAVAAGPIEFS